jgi:putative PIN family toxin of toxin-antitoxin system
MQKIIIDTNVFVSALIQRNYPFYVVDSLFSNSEIQLCISDTLFEEYYEVLNREKFSRFPEFLTLAQVLLVEIEKRASKYYPTIKLDIVRDLDDNKLLELAESCEADFLITGNSNDFTMQEHKTTKIVTPKEYWENHLPK